MKIPAKGFTHGGKFHADDVFATALLMIVRPDIKVTRGFVVPDGFDGIVYDVGCGMFDHHQEPRESRPNGVPYAAFGLLWLGSVPTREPLCAAYVKYGYGGEDALANPIFMRTNRILASAWGVLYLLIALWTALLGNAFAGWVLPVANNVATALMGALTVWFEHRYPAWVASGKGLCALFWG